MFRWIATVLRVMGHVIINVFTDGKKKHKKHGKSVRFGYAIGLPRVKSERIPMPLDLTITNEQEVDVTVTPVTETGKPAKLDGKPSVSVISGNSTFTQSDDGLTITLRSSDDPGDTDFLVKADADLGEGVQEISDTIRLHVSGAQAANLGLVAGTPRAKT